MKHSLRSMFSEDIRRILGQNIGRTPAPMYGGILRAGSYGAAKTRLKTDVVNATPARCPPPPPNKVLLGPPLVVNPSERLFPRPYRSMLSQLRSGYYSRPQFILHRVGRASSPACPDCGSAPHTTEQLFSCPRSPTDLAPADLWTTPLQAALFISSIPSFADLPPFPVLPGGPAPSPLPNLHRSRAPRPHTHMRRDEHPIIPVYEFLLSLKHTKCFFFSRCLELLCCGYGGLKKSSNNNKNSKNVSADTGSANFFFFSKINLHIKFVAVL